MDELFTFRLQVCGSDATREERPGLAKPFALAWVPEADTQHSVEIK